ncbi:hypothetical protein RRG08_059072 [Elysia crispata]|uniref:Uncharacterized protein n=1 Tax=Elysia crispata TaxID=231223 RepID=A0AAE1B8T5_9GAST|nr:hypothetical protein RRG08_059072 [Elysia crispata]
MQVNCIKFYRDVMEIKLEIVESGAQRAYYFVLQPIINLQRTSSPIAPGSSPTALRYSPTAPRFSPTAPQIFPYTGLPG